MTTTALSGKTEVAGMARCKRCKAAKRVTGVATRHFQRTDRWGHNVFHRSVSFARMECWNGCVSRVNGDTTVEINEIRGTVTEEPCDARCTNAKGHLCECSCGGKNHGKSWGAA